MAKEIIQFIMGAVTMFAIYAILESMDNKGSRPRDEQEDADHYVVRMPGALKRVYGFVFGFGMFLFFVFFAFKVTVGASVTNAHLIFALIIAGIGLLVVAVSSKWHICVNGDEATIYRLFHKTQTVLFREIGKVEVGGKYQISIYRNGKKLVTIDALSDNYERIMDSLNRAGKV